LIVDFRLISRVVELACSCYKQRHLHKRVSAVLAALVGKESTSGEAIRGLAAFASVDESSHRDVKGSRNLPQAHPRFTHGQRHIPPEYLRRSSKLLAVLP
jgi:hypothetical protein